MQKTTTSSAPGADELTNKILRNLDKDSIQEITEYNNCWKDGWLPDTRKHTKVLLLVIPKPGKKLTNQPHAHVPNLMLTEGFGACGAI